jgi:hypothetical protein
MKIEERGRRGMINCQEKTIEGRRCSAEGVYLFQIEPPEGDGCGQSILCRVHASVLRRKGFTVTPIALPSGTPLAYLKRRNLILAAARRRKMGGCR